LVVASLESVDCVVNLSEDRPRALIERWLPEFYIKGGDYGTGSLRSSEVVARYGGETIFIPVEYDSSTSGLIDYIQALEKHSLPEPLDNVEETPYSIPSPSIYCSGFWRGSEHCIPLAFVCAWSPTNKELDMGISDIVIS
jgi:hypothetical protein